MKGVGAAARRWQVAALAAVSCVALPDAADAAEKRRTALGTPAATVTADGRLSVSVTVRNTSRATVRRVSLRVWLSTDRRLDRRDAAAGRLTVRNLRPGARTRARARLRVPSSVRPGRRRVLVCASAKARSCRAGRAVTIPRRRGATPGGALTVPAPFGVVPPGAPSTAPAPAPPASGGGSGGGGGDGGGAGWQTPDPLTVAPQRDAARAATARVTPDAGGTVQATAADGTVLRLTVPAKAVLSPVDVTVTPLTGVGGLPLSGGFTAGAHFGPDGLRLQQPATLTIEPPTPVPAGGRMAFGYYGDGDDFHLVPLGGGGALTLAVQHFSGVGVGSGTSADRDAQQQRMPLRTEAQFLQQTEALIAAGDTAGLTELSRSYYRQIIRPKLEAGLASDERGREAVVAGIGFARSAQLTGLGDALAAEIAEIFDYVDRITIAAYDRGFARCVQRQPLAVVDMLGMYRQMAIQGKEGRLDATKMERCLVFELDTRVHAEDAYNSTRYRLTVTGNDATLRSASGAFDPVLTGEVPLRVDEWHAEFSSCPETAEPASVTRHASAELQLWPNLVETTLPDGTVQTRVDVAFEIVYDGGAVATPERYFCNHPGNRDVPAYATAFTRLRGSTAPEGAETLLVVHDWQHLGGDPFARRDYRVQLASSTTDAQFVLRHTPDV